MPTAESSDSTLAISATVTTPSAMAPISCVHGCPPGAIGGRCGRPMASKKLPDSWIRSTCRSTSNDSAVAATIATRAPGMNLTLGGSFGHNNRIAMTTLPTITSCSSWFRMPLGSASIFAHAELRDDPPSST
jgi:hypothetical protein